MMRPSASCTWSAQKRSPSFTGVSPFPLGSGSDGTGSGFPLSPPGFAPPSAGSGVPKTGWGPDRSIVRLRSLRACLANSSTMLSWTFSVPSSASQYRTLPLASETTVAPAGLHSLRPSASVRHASGPSPGRVSSNGGRKRPICAGPGELCAWAPVSEKEPPTTATATASTATLRRRPMFPPLGPRRRKVLHVRDGRVLVEWAVGARNRPGVGQTRGMQAAAILVLSFAVGAIPFSYVAGRRARGVDLRRVGTGTVSGTSLYRVAGFGPLAAAGVLGVTKGAAGPSLAVAAGHPALAAVAGGAPGSCHNWSTVPRPARGRG